MIICKRPAPPDDQQLGRRGGGGVTRVIGVTRVTGQKDEKKEKEKEEKEEKKEEKKFLHTCGRGAGVPVKGSTSGPRGPKTEVGKLAGLL